MAKVRYFFLGPTKGLGGCERSQHKIWILKSLFELQPVTQNFTIPLENNPQQASTWSFCCLIILGEKVWLRLVSFAQRRRRKSYKPAVFDLISLEEGEIEETSAPLLEKANCESCYSKNYSKLLATTYNSMMFTVLFPDVAPANTENGKPYWLKTQHWPQSLCAIVRNKPLIF